LNEDIIPFNLHHMGQSRFGGRHAHRSTCTNIELRTMPGAYNARAFQKAIAESATVVRAQVFHAEDLIVQKNDDDETIFDLKSLRLIGL
jgi:hypothetical protein